MEACLSILLNFVVVTMKHEEARRRVCLGCFSKTNIEIASLPANVQELIEKHIFSDYNKASNCPKIKNIVVILLVAISISSRGSDRDNMFL